MKKLVLNCLVIAALSVMVAFTSCGGGSSSGGGGSSSGKGKIIMKTKGNVKLNFEGTGTVAIDWGDGNRETHEMGKIIDHYYSDFTERTITIDGKNITLINCSKSRVTFLDVSNCSTLRHLKCHENELTILDLSKNTKLEVLWCSDNGLINLDVSKNTALVSLDCDRNELTSLDVSKCTALVELDCSHNQLKSLDMSKNRALFELNCSGNLLTGSALDALFRTLNSSDNEKSIAINHNPGVKDCDETIAIKKGWRFRELGY